MTEASALVRATIRKHQAEAELSLAKLESVSRTVPATLRSNNDMLRLTKKIKEARSVLEAWNLLLSMMEAES